MHTLPDRDQLSANELEPVRIKRKMPAGFRVARYQVEALSVCGTCAEKAAGGES